MCPPDEDRRGAPPRSRARPAAPRPSRRRCRCRLRGAAPRARRRGDAAGRSAWRIILSDSNSSPKRTFDPRHRVALAACHDPQPQPPVVAVWSFVASVGRDTRAARQRPDRAVVLDQRDDRRWPAADQPVGHRRGAEEHALVAIAGRARARRVAAQGHRGRSGRRPAPRPAGSSPRPKRLPVSRARRRCTRSLRI